MGRVDSPRLNRRAPSGGRWPGSNAGARGERNVPFARNRRNSREGSEPEVALTSLHKWQVGPR